MDAEEEKAWRLQQQEWLAFKATPIGTAFAKYDAAIGRAWVSDCQGSDARMKRDWDTANCLRDELIALLRAVVLPSDA